MRLVKEFGQRISRYLRQLTDTGWSRQYDFYMIFGQDDPEQSPWIKSNWESHFEPYFDLLIKQTKNQKDTGISVIKYKKEKRISKKDNTEFTYHSDLKLGRLNWDSKSHEKWTLENETDHYFLNFELWSPIWTICEKKQTAPDIFISINNERDFENKRDIKFSYFIVVSIAQNLNIDSIPILRALSEKINSKATILKTRRWNKPEKAGEWTFTNWIQDTFCNGIYQGKNIHTLNFEDLKFGPQWEIIYRQK